MHSRRSSDHRELRYAPSYRSSSRHLALCFGAIDAERVELGELMEETLLWRDGHHSVRIGEEDRLAQLTVPIAEIQLHALEAGEIELIAAHIAKNGLGLDRSRPRRRLGYRPSRHPARIVATAHPTYRLTAEAVLQLRRPPTLERSRPGCRHHTLGSGHRAGIGS